MQGRLITRVVLALVAGLIVIGDAAAARASIVAMTCCAKADPAHLHAFALLI